MNKKHKKTEGGASIASWIPGNLIERINEVVKATNQSRSFVIAESVRCGLDEALRLHATDANGNKGAKK